MNRFINKQSPIHKWHPFCKSLSLFFLITGFSFVQTPYLLLPQLFIALALLLLSRSVSKEFFRSIRFPGILLLFVILIMPFFSGSTIVYKAGIFTIKKEGLVQSMIIAGKFTAIYSTAYVLFATTKFTTLIKVLRAAKVPHAAADIIMFTYRYIITLGEVFQRMKTALVIRGFKRKKLKKLALLTGNLFLTSYEQSVSVFNAMFVRG